MADSQTKTRPVRVRRHPNWVARIKKYVGRTYSHFVASIASIRRRTWLFFKEKIFPILRYFVENPDKLVNWALFLTFCVFLYFFGFTPIVRTAENAICHEIKENKYLTDLAHLANAFCPTIVVGDVNGGQQETEFDRINSTIISTSSHLDRKADEIITRLDRIALSSRALPNVAVGGMSAEGWVYVGSYAGNLWITGENDRPPIFYTIEPPADFLSVVRSQTPIRYRLVVPANLHGAIPTREAPRPSDPFGQLYAGSYLMVTRIEQLPASLSRPSEQLVRVWARVSFSSAMQVER